MFPVGFAISVYRRMKELSAATVAKQLGISRGFLSILETGLRLPPVSLEFASAVSEFLGIENEPVLASITCEHLFASVKNLKWLPSLFCSGISMGFRRYYIYGGHLSSNFSNAKIYVLSPVDKFRLPLLKELILKHLDHVAGNFTIAEEKIVSGDVEYATLGYFTNVKPILFSGTNELFPLRESITFIDQFSVSDGLLYFFDFHTPFTDPNKLKLTTLYISPFEKDPIQFIDHPVLAHIKKPTQ